MEDPLNTELTEPQILFLGTTSMRPQLFKGATSICIFSKSSAVMMDCAEGTYGQLYDHFNSKEKVDQALLKIRALFITHIHGDHQLGTLKVVYERDQAIAKLPED